MNVETPNTPNTGLLVRGRNTCSCLTIFSKSYTGLVVVRTWSRLPTWGGQGVMLHWPIFWIPLKMEKTPHDLCTILFYVDIGGNPTRQSRFASLAPAGLRLCSEGSVSPLGGIVVETTG